MVSAPASLDDLWNSAAAAQGFFNSELVADIPESARRYLRHAIALGTPLATAVRLKMHGEIKLKGWHPFTAEQVICWGRGMIWSASVRMYGIPIRGSDRFVDGWGAMVWKLLGIVPLVNVSGPDITRSAGGRTNIEAVSWLPSVLCGDQVSWTNTDASHPHVRLTGNGETAELDFTVDGDARLKSMSMLRWGNPGGGSFRYHKFGALVEAEGTFGGYTIPTRLCVGWYFGTDRFVPDGEFFRVTIDDAIYR